MKHGSGTAVRRNNGLETEREFLTGLIFATGDYMALVVSAYLAVALRNIIMTYTVYHVGLLYIFFFIPLVFMAFILYSGLYTKRMVMYKWWRNYFILRCMGRYFLLFLCLSRK